MTRISERRDAQDQASISSAGRLTLTRDVLRLPRELVDYVVCHELLHLRIEAHNKAFHAMLSAHIPDWGEREPRLAACVLASQDAG
jgi:predicted metal-dependent hydrolase